MLATSSLTAPLYCAGAALSNRRVRSNAAVSDDPRAIHIHPTAPLAERVLLPGDPGRALALAQELLERPLMFNHNRGLWGYTGTATDGEPLTIQSTGMGGPSAAIVLEELIALGATRAVRVGTAGALVDSLRLGELLLASEAIAADGTSRALGASELVAADSSLLAALQHAAPDVRCGLIVSSDLFYEVDEQRFAGWREAGALAVEMEAATLFAVGRRRGIRVACALAITDVLTNERERIDPAALTQAGLDVGRLGLSALL
jgi:DeoD family purine-nucleoside phosphorylase